MQSFRLVETPCLVSALYSNLAVSQVAVCPTSGKGQVPGESWSCRKGCRGEAGWIGGGTIVITGTGSIIAVLREGKGKKVKPAQNILKNENTYLQKHYWSACMCNNFFLLCCLLHSPYSCAQTGDACPLHNSYSNVSCLNCYKAIVLLLFPHEVIFLNCMS